MSRLSDYRLEINTIDEEIAKLFEKRMNVCRGIAAYKKEHGMPVRVPKRESELTKKNEALIEDDEIRSYYIRFLKATIDISCDFQEMLMNGMNIAYGGDKGAFAYIAARRMFPKSQLISMSDFTEAYKSVENGTCDCAVLPIENSLAGDVGTVRDLMYSGSLYINRIYDLPIRHQLLGCEGADLHTVKTVISHPQALAQCGNYLKEHGFVTRSAANTSEAAARVVSANDPAVAAIASVETAELTGLQILDRDIQNPGINTTRFAAFSRSMNRFSGDSKTGDEGFILVFTVKNEAGALAATLNIIGAHGYNMRSLKSRPLQDLPWSYYFFVEADGNIHNENGRQMLRELSALCAGLKLVGSYN